MVYASKEIAEVNSLLLGAVGWEATFSIGKLNYFCLLEETYLSLFFTDLECSDWLKSFGMFKNEHSVNLRSNILKTSEPRFNSQ